MNHEFVITPGDIYRIILATAGFIVAVAGAVKVIMEAISKAKEPDKIQNERITKLEEEVGDIKSDIEKVFDKQKKVDEAWNIYMQAMFALINHSIEGDNNIEELREVRNQMQNFLSKNKTK